MGRKRLPLLPDKAANPALKKDSPKTHGRVTLTIINGAIRPSSGMAMDRQSLDEYT
ncbi:MAG: hypothetical protein ACREAQ_03130 [Nitrososphaera sp.]